MRRGPAAPAALLGLLALAACGGGGTGARPSRTPYADPDPGVPGAVNHTVDSISVHTLGWLSEDELVTVEYGDGNASVKTWVFVHVETGVVRRFTPPAPRDCPAAVLTGPAYLRENVVAYVERCPDPKRSRVLSYDARTNATTVLVDAGDVPLEQATLGPDGRPLFAWRGAGGCPGMVRVSGNALDPGPLTAAPGWDLAAPLRGADCKTTGRAAFARVDGAGKRLAFIGTPPGERALRVYVSPLAAFAPVQVGPPIPQPGDLAWSGNGKSVYVTSRVAGTFLGLSRIDVATGKVTRVYDKTVTGLALSPDGKRLAILKPRPHTTTLAILPVT